MDYKCQCKSQQPGWADLPFPGSWALKPLSVSQQDLFPRIPLPDLCFPPPVPHRSSPLSWSPSLLRGLDTLGQPQIAPLSEGPPSGQCDFSERCHRVEHIWPLKEGTRDKASERHTQRQTAGHAKSSCLFKCFPLSVG